VLGPLLFLIFVQDLPDCVKSSIKMFADDTNTWTNIACLGDADSLQQDLERPIGPTMVRQMRQYLCYALR